ncbi:MAG: glutamyl-tRNA reductase [Acetivibrionales bacterium]|jgi:glutamyl-tRNA reductase
MNIQVCGINFKAAPLDIREKLSFNLEEQKKALTGIYGMENICECLILSTCNRTEIYTCFAGESPDRDCIEEFICSIKGLDVHDFKKYFYYYCGLKAVRHIFKVSCGLESMVLGEDQILGQVKSAYKLALEEGTTSVVLNTLFRDVITAAKKVKTRTGLSRNPVSVASLAVKYAFEQYGGKPENTTALVIGSGEIGTIAIKNLLSWGTDRVFIASRSHSRLSLNAKFNTKVSLIAYQDRYSFMDNADIIISCTSSPHYTVTADMLEKSLAAYKTRVFVDLAVPRDIDIAIKGIAGVKYFNIDQLKEAADANTRRKLLESMKAEKMLEEYVADFERWYEFRNVLPTVRKLHEETYRIAAEKMERTISRLKTASDEDKEAVRQSTRNIVNFMMDRFVYKVKDYGTKKDIRAYFKCLSEVAKECER